MDSARLSDLGLFLFIYLLLTVACSPLLEEMIFNLGLGESQNFQDPGAK